MEQGPKNEEPLAGKQLEENVTPHPLSQEPEEFITQEGERISIYHPCFKRGFFHDVQEEEPWLYWVL